MEYVTHSNVNSTIGPPSDMSSEDCGVLPVRVWSDDYGPWVTSFWRPSPEELQALIDGGSIGLNLRCGARQHPVVFMSTYAKEPHNGH